LYKQSESKLKEIEPRFKKLSALEMKIKNNLLEKIGDEEGKFDNLDVDQLEIIAERISGNNTPANSAGVVGTPAPPTPAEESFAGMTDAEIAKSLGLV